MAAWCIGIGSTCCFQLYYWLDVACLGCWLACLAAWLSLGLFRQMISPDLCLLYFRSGFAIILIAHSLRQSALMRVSIGYV